jgi:TIR domain
VSKTPRAASIKPAGHVRRAVKLFISYSHHNRVWMERLTPLLDGFQYDDRLKNRSALLYLHHWHDKELKAGNPWDYEIKKELDEMDIFVPLVSTHFFASPYVQEIELTRARDRWSAGEILVVPIILYDLNLRERSAFLNGFKSLPAQDRWWSSYRSTNDAHRLIDAGLWEAIDGALNRKLMRNS